MRTSSKTSAAVVSPMEKVGTVEDQGQPQGDRESPRAFYLSLSVPAVLLLNPALPVLQVTSTLSFPPRPHEDHDSIVHICVVLR